MSAFSSSKTPAAASSFTNAFVDDNPLDSTASQSPLQQRHLDHSSTIRNNLFVGSADDVMSKVRYRPVETRDVDDDDDAVDAQSHLRHRPKSTTSSMISSASASDDGFTDEQYLLRHSTTSSTTCCKIPHKAICLAIFLFCLGTIMCVIGGLLLSGIYIDQKYNDRTWPVLCLGLLMFIPGSYHVRIAYYAWKRVPGYHYSDIPDWD